MEPITLNHYAYANSTPSMYVDPSGKYSSIAELSISLKTIGILASGAIASLAILNSSSGEYGGNIWLTVAVYNARIWLREEYIAMVMYMAGRATDSSPFGKVAEADALKTDPNDPCKFIEKAIAVLEAQIAWRYSAIIDGTREAKGYYMRIEILQKNLDMLKEVYNIWSKK